MRRKCIQSILVMFAMVVVVVVVVKPLLLFLLHDKHFSLPPLVAGERREPSVTPPASL